ncbi:MAG: NAD-dependent epimerase/dehydratase family protein [Methanothermobacter tenebrarum]
MNLSLGRSSEGKGFVFHQKIMVGVPESVEDPHLLWANATGIFKLLVAAFNVKVGKVINVSTSAVYGRSIEMLLSEDARPIPPLSCAVFKAPDRYYCMVFSRYDLDTVSLRYFNVYALGKRSDSQHATFILRFINAIINGEDPPDLTWLFEVMSQIIGSFDEKPIDVKHSHPDTVDTPPFDRGGFTVSMVELAGRWVSSFRGFISTGSEDCPHVNRYFFAFHPPMGNPAGKVGGCGGVSV